MVEEQVFNLLFTPGFSTHEGVSETSGRGVGLDVVRDAIARIKGMVEVTSRPNEGASFIMKLPLTLAITESLLAIAGNDTFAIPVDSVIETIRVNPGDIKTVETKDVITVRGHILPVVKLHDIFGLPAKGIVEKKFFPIVIVQSVEKRIGILVDQLLGRQDIIGKSLGDPLRQVRNIAGATILGNGKVVLILDVPSIIRAAEGGVVRKVISASKSVAPGKKKKTILLAEDVLSTAMLEKNILESVGYAVVIARDGKEALEKASQESFDLVISDVLMPRMDGFELVTRLRREKLYKEVPIIIVTTRESDEDKRKGMEAGANAYLLKSDFTSEGLLETIERLLG
jgi:two-component system, chemotaxis family, sensor kinase CheA